jgi:PadR family transcriptional regulator, regulatory protein PadR
MQDRILRRLFLGFIQIHILHHAGERPVYGSWMISELKAHGYEMSPGTLYPILHSLEASGLLEKEQQVVGGKVRKYYSLTESGRIILEEARKKAFKLFKEIK